MEALAHDTVRTTPQQVLDAVNEHGTINPLQGYIELKRMEMALSEAIAKLRDKATEEAATYGKGEHHVYGAVINHRAGAGRWDFTSLPWYGEIAALQSSIDMTRKAKEDMAKNAYKLREAMKPLPCDVETGEEIQPAAYTPGKDTVAISLPKAK